MKNFKRNEEQQADKDWLTENGHKINNVDEFFSTGSDKLIGFFSEENRALNVATSAADLANIQPSTELYAIESSLLQTEGELLDTE